MKTLMNESGPALGKAPPPQRRAPTTRMRTSAGEREASGTNARARRGSGDGIVQGDERAKQARQP